MHCGCANLLQSCPTLCDPVDCSPPGSSVHGILQSKNTGVGCHALLQEIFQTQGKNPCLLHLLYWQAGSWFTVMAYSQFPSSSPSPESPASPGSGCSMPELEKFQCQVTIKSEITKSRKVSSLLNQMLPLAPCPVHAHLAVGGDRPKGAVFPSG